MTDQDQAGGAGEAPQFFGGAKHSPLPDSETVGEVGPVQRVAGPRVVEAQAGNAGHRQALSEIAPELARAHLLEAPWAEEKNCAVALCGTSCRFSVEPDCAAERHGLCRGPLPAHLVLGHAWCLAR